MSKLTLLIVFFFWTFTIKAEKSIIIQSTTSLKNSGFYDYIIPFIYKDLSIKINVVAVGTGAAIRNSMNCDGDLLIVHSPTQEQEFIAQGYSDKSYYLMHNYFIVIGPRNDPAKINKSNDIKSVFKKIFKTKSYFVSRGDNSGTHFREKKIWKDIELNPLVYSGGWYLETGTNMGATINTALGLNAYSFTDKATWISFKNKLDYQIYIENESNLLNEYSALVINKKKCPLTNEVFSMEIIKWLLSDKAKNLIEKFKKDNQQLFFIK